MYFNNTTYDHYFIGYADLTGKGEVIVEHYWATSPFDCMKQCLMSHDIFVHPNIDTTEGLTTLARHRNKIVSIPRKVKVTIV